MERFEKDRNENSCKRQEYVAIIRLTMAGVANRMGFAYRRYRGYENCY